MKKAIIIVVIAVLVCVGIFFLGRTFWKKDTGQSEGPKRLTVTPQTFEVDTLRIYFPQGSSLSTVGQMPEKTYTSTFTVTNTGTASVKYQLGFGSVSMDEPEDVAADDDGTPKVGPDGKAGMAKPDNAGSGKRIEELTYTLACTSSGSNMGANVKDAKLPISNDGLNVDGVYTIEANEVHTYTVTITSVYGGLTGFRSSIVVKTVK